MELAVPANSWIKLKECKKKNKYLDLARELKKLWNMRVTIVPIVIGAFGTVTKGLLKGLENLQVGGRVDTLQMTALLKTVRILRRILETCGGLLPLKLQWKTISYRWCEKLYRNNYDNDNNNVYTNKWYMHNLTSALENDLLKLIWDFDIQTLSNKVRGIFFKRTVSLLFIVSSLSFGSFV